MQATPSSAKPTATELAGAIAAVLFAAACLTTTGAVLIHGSDYYMMARDLRTEHALHAMLRPGGPLGLTLGIAGTVLMTVMLTYTLRKWLLKVQWLGPPSWWLRFHMMCGVLGPIMIVVHGGLVIPRGFVAIAFWCMVMSAASGVFGRYVYGHIPKTAAGRRMDLTKAREAMVDLRADLVALTEGAKEDAINEAITLARELESGPRGVAGLLVLDLAVRRRTRGIRAALAGSGLPKDVQRSASATLASQLSMTRDVEVWELSRRLFRYWHLFHMPLAQAMYLLVALHVFYAIVFGGALTTLATWGAAP